MINFLTFVGSIGDVQPIKYNSKGKPYIKMVIANRIYTDTQWFEVFAFDYLAERYAEEFQIGDIVLVHGMLRIKGVKRDGKWSQYVFIRAIDIRHLILASDIKRYKEMPDAFKTPKNNEEYQKKEEEIIAQLLDNKDVLCNLIGRDK